ncbi:PhnA Zinc-Ribbon family [Verrucomicrobiia bacterium DG1235]|nr:PhnA Zinc-Ribbon family [Verrucomicrobiae bacterium DG1235]
MALGKDLTRRAGSKCELCESAGVSLRPYEVPPEEEEPRVESCVFICDTCREQLDKPKRMNVDHWRCACQSVWSEVPVVQVLAARVLDHLGKKEIWAREALADVYFDEEVESWISLKAL